MCPRTAIFVLWTLDGFRTKYGNYSRWMWRRWWYWCNLQQRLITKSKVALNKLPYYLWMMGLVQLIWERWWMDYAHSKAELVKIATFCAIHEQTEEADIQPWFARESHRIRTRLFREQVATMRLLRCTNEISEDMIIPIISLEKCSVHTRS